MRMTGKFTALLKDVGNRWFVERKEKNISARAAKRIQRHAYEDGFVPLDESITPVYRDIAAHLSSKNAQIVRAAIFDLYKTAKNSETARAGVLEILLRKAESMPAESELSVYLREKIACLQKM